jgi:hypothetical protein
MTPQRQLKRFLSKYDKNVAATAEQAAAKLRKLIPPAIELVYDNYNALAIGFGPSEKASEAIFSIALYPKYASLFLLQGASLPDPSRRLEGSGNVARHIKLRSKETIDDPQIIELINVALHRAKVPLKPGGSRKLIIKSVSTKQRPRKPAAQKRSKKR